MILKPKDTRSRKQGLIAGGSLSALASYLFYTQNPHAVIAAAFACGIILLAVMYPRALNPVFTVIRLILRMISCVFSVLIFSFIFFLVFTVIGIFMKLMGKDPLKKRFSPTKSSYWDTEHIEDKKNKNDTFQY